MARRPRNEWAPVYRILLKSSWYGDCVPTCVVAGPNRHRAWLYVHTTTPTVLRLHPQVVRFLHDSLTELATPTDNGISCWSLPKRTDVSYPGAWSTDTTTTRGSMCTRRHRARSGSFRLWSSSSSMRWPSYRRLGCLTHAALRFARDTDRVAGV
jgi:hypothetical protein